jgi:polysaccharide export outer membrane protein
MSHGGPSREADVSKVILARQVQGRGMVENIDLREIMGKGDMRKNYILKDGDIVYVSESGASKVNYYLTRLLPSMQVVDFALRTAESSGVLAELRRKLWGQEGFVGTGATTGPAASPNK